MSTKPETGVPAEVAADPDARQADSPGAAAAVAGLVLFGVALAGVVAATLVSLTVAGPVPGIPDAGWLVRLGLPVTRVVAQCAAVVTVGTVLFAVFLAPHRRSGYLDVGGYRAMRAAMWPAAVWAGAAVLLVPLTVADAVGRPFADVLDLAVLGEAVPALGDAEMWLLTAGIAAVVAVSTRLVLSWGWSLVVLAAAVGGLLPLGASGHSAAGGSHDIATNSLLLHVIAAALWVGGLVALLVHGPRDGRHLGLAASRFSRLALVCWLVMAASGVINALVRLPLGDLLDTGYGRLTLGKVAALLALGVIGYWQRQRSVRAVVDRGDRASLLRLGGVEVLVMLGTIGLAVALGRTQPPVLTGELSTAELLIGYDLTGPPTLARLLLDWRFDLIYGTGAVVAAGLYLAGVRRLRRRGDSWPVGRTVAWLAGCATVLVATSSGIGRYAPALFSVHMGSHMLLSMLAPVLLVLGGAVTLGLRALPAVSEDDPPGAREWLLAVVRSPLSRVLTHPLVALALFAGSFYALYFSGLFEVALTRHWAHLAMNAHFLLVGYAFYWPLIGVDPAPHRLQPLGRLGVLFASLPFHAFFGITLMLSQTVIGGEFYRALADGLPWTVDLLADQRLGGGMAWASGELPLLVVLVALMVQWANADQRAARRADSRAEADGDAELAAYNAMLRDLAQRPGRPPADPGAGRPRP